jgi:hypothetical protein
MYDYEDEPIDDDYCAACVHAGACDVMLKDGEDCGDRIEALDGEDVSEPGEPAFDAFLGACEPGEPDEELAAFKSRGNRTNAR